MRLISSSAALLEPVYGKAVGKDAALQVFAKGLLDIRCRPVVVALAVELASSSQVSKCSATVRYSRVRLGLRGSQALVAAADWAG